MSRPFDSVELIFNPNSTGNARERAEQLHQELAEREPGLPVQLRPTEHAWHGREIARGSGTFLPSTIALTPEIGYA